MDKVVRDTDIKINRNFPVFIFFVWPLFSLYLAIKNIKASWSKNIIWLFIIFYGFSFALVNDKIDAYAHAQLLIKMHATSLSLSNFTELLYTEETNYLDIFHPLITFIVSLFTDKHKYLLAVYGFVYGFFFSRNIAYLVSVIKGKIQPVVLLFILTFAFVIPIWSINGFRMWAAAHMVMYGFLPFLLEGKKDKLWVVVSSVFMHFSFAIVLAVIATYLILGKKTKLYFILFVITFFINELNIEVVKDLLETYTPTIVNSRTKTYLGTDYLSDLADKAGQANFYAEYYIKFLSWPILLLISLIYFRGKKFINENNGFKNLYSFALLFCAFANIANLLPSGSRFIIISQMVAVFGVVYYMHYANIDRFNRFITFIIVPSIIMYLITSIRIGFDTMSVATLIFNPIFVIFNNTEIPLIDLIK